MTAPTPSPERVYGKILRRLLPFLTICFALAYLDRLNIGFAKLQLAADLQLSDTAYGLGAGIFFLGYLLLEVPGNLILQRIGPRRWLGLIMMLWGGVSLATAFVHTIPMLYVARFLLGAAEAGFFPGAIYYLTLWFPDSRRASVVALLLSALPLSGVFGGPISGVILQNMSATYGLHGWQWLFILEGMPSILAGIAAFFILEDRVGEASWLTVEERAFVQEAVAAESASKQTVSLARTLTDPHLYVLGLVYFCYCMGLYGISFWLPQLLKNAGATDPIHIGALSVVPYAVAIPLMIAASTRSDARGDRYRMLTICSLAATLGLAASAWQSNNLSLALASLTFTTAAVFAALPILWVLPTQYLTGGSAAAGIALVNSLGGLSGFVSPTLIGIVRDRTHSTGAALLLVAFFVNLGGILVATLSRKAKRISQQPLAQVIPIHG